MAASTSTRRTWAAEILRAFGVLLAGLVVSAGCASASTQASTASQPAGSGPSGITGQVVVTVCGGADVGSQSCPQRPVLATIDVLRMPSRRRVATVRSNRSGRFHVDLPPGAYDLLAHASGTLLAARPVTTRVRPHRFTDVTVRMLPRHPLPVGASG